MGEVIVITSGKGGVGKTTVSAHLGAALAELGHKTLLIDTDIGLRNLDLVLGLESRIVYDIIDATEGACKLKQAIVRDKRRERLYLIPAAQTRDKSALSAEQLTKLVQPLRKTFDYLLVDCPAGIEHGFETACACADTAIVVTMPEVSAVRDADRVIGLLNARGLNSRLIINRLRPDMVRDGDMMTISDTRELLGIDLIGVLPDDENVIRAANVGAPLPSHSKSAQAYLRIARRVTGQAVPIPDIMGRPTLMQRLKTLGTQVMPRVARGQARARM